VKKPKKAGSAKGQLIVSGSSVPPPALEASFVEVVDPIRQARQRAFQAVNTELIDLYWRVGQYMSRKLETARGARAWWTSWLTTSPASTPILRHIIAPTCFGCGSCTKVIGMTKKSRHW
jgi:hypothetical protein